MQPPGLVSSSENRWVTHALESDETANGRGFVNYRPSNTFGYSVKYFHPHWIVELQQIYGYATNTAVQIFECLCT